MRERALLSYPLFASTSRTHSPSLSLSLCHTHTYTGIIPMRGEGGFFLIGDTRNIHVPQEYLDMSTPAMVLGIERQRERERAKGREGGRERESAREQAGERVRGR
jgi:hypothetical protein